MEMHHISRQEIGRALSIFYRCPFIEYDESRVIDPGLVQEINLGYLKANYWIPLRAMESTVEVLIDDPHSVDKIRDIKRLFPGKEIQCAVGLQADILKYVNALNVGPAPKVTEDSILEILGQLEAEESEDPDEAPVEQFIDENDNAIVRLVNQIIRDAFKSGASDIHIEPYGENRETVVRFRSDGECFEYLKVPPAYRRALVSRLKIMAQLDISERRKPQDGKIKVRLANQEVELRMATVPTAGASNEDVVLRILGASKPLPLDQLNMSERNLREFTQLLYKPYGLILCVGPTGSGKTTTLHSALAKINTPKIKIWTAEDPVEITQYGLRQVQVNSRIGFDFAATMRAFLRADPDVIMVGEIRDRETAQICIEASLTGHRVLSTLHTNSAVETVTRLLEIGMDAFNFADALLGVLSQRLARTICQYCKERCHPPREEYELLAYGYGEEAFAGLGIPYDEHFYVYRGEGCQHCHQDGYRGRIALHELAVATKELKSLIQARASVAELSRVAMAQGMMTLLQDGIFKVLQGWTDYSQVRAVAMS
jgi:type II secretory ATPase GspE/PulE/Tfp pilus assembly ATPase PilB-like protein